MPFKPFGRKHPFFADQAWRKAAHERAKGKILQDEMIFESRQEGRKNGDKTETLYKSEKEYEAENAHKENTDDDSGELVDSEDEESWGDGEYRSLIVRSSQPGFQV